jgi:hypothetical protein
MESLREGRLSAPPLAISSIRLGNLITAGVHSGRDVVPGMIAAQWSGFEPARSTFHAAAGIPG